MDRFKFRGVKKDCGDFLEFAIGYLIPSENKKYPSRIVQDCFEYDVIEETIGQCTGLKDKNGKLIFEGDMLKCQYVESFSNLENKERACFVKYVAGSFVLINSDNQIMFILGERPCSHEIIGTIHDDN
jgi:uncharacterized phage protein (TIGR01671 family)